MAAVFVAEDLRLNRPVALKVMLPGLAFTEGMSERFEQEARTAANLDHPNIVTIYSVEQLDDLLFFVMKYVKGKSLDKVTRDLGPLPIDVTQFILKYVTLALAYAHDERVVHRDVKPGNVLLDRKGTPIVTDFGIAKAAESPSLTVPGSIVGTPAYMSPEQFMGLPAVPASDQYALGVMAYEMLAGELPFQGTMVELQLKHIQDAPKPVREIRKDVSPALERIVMRMLSKQPGDRFSTLHEAEAALRALPLDENTARVRLVELGFLTDSTSPFGLPPTPARSGDKPKVSGEIAPPKKELQSDSKGQSREATPPRIRLLDRETPRDVAAVGNDDKTVVSPRQTPGATPSVPPIPEVAYILITPLPANVAAGAAVPLQGVAYDQTNTPIPGKHVAWDVSPVGAGKIAPDGTLITLVPGALTVTAICDGKRSLAEIQVTPVPQNIAPVRPKTPEVAHDPVKPPELPREPERRERVIVKGREDSAERTKTPTFLTPRVGAIAAGVGALVLVALFTIPRLTSPREQPQGPSQPGGAVPDSAPQGSAQQSPVNPSTASTTAEQAPAVNQNAGEPGTPEVPNSTTANEGTAAAALTPASVRIVGPTTQLRIGDRSRVHAEVRAQNGSAIAAPRVTWKSSDPSVLQIDGRSGAVRALRAGRAEITAKSGLVEAQLSMQVATPKLLALVVEDARSLTVGESLTLHLTAQSDAGTVDATTLGTMGITPHWTSSAPAVARIDARTGEVTAVGRGNATITVDAGSVKGSAMLAVAGPQQVPGPVIANPPQPNPTTDRTPRIAERKVRTEADVRREVGDALNAYAAAVRAQDLDGIQRVFSGMQEKDRETWRGFFAAATDFSYTVDRLEFAEPIDVSEGGQVQLTRYFTLSYTTKKDNRAQRSSGKDRVTLVRKSDGWHITQVR